MTKYFVRYIAFALFLYYLLTQTEYLIISQDTLLQDFLIFLGTITFVDFVILPLLKILTFPVNLVSFGASYLVVQFLSFYLIIYFLKEVSISGIEGIVTFLAGVVFIRAVTNILK